MVLDETREQTAQRSADQLALALEDVGFDVGRTFPGLRGVVDKSGNPAVQVGQVSAVVAARLTDVLRRAALQGVTG